MKYEIMSVSYTELENNCPAICICSDFIIPITTKGLVKSFIGFCDKDLRFNLNGLSNSILKFKSVLDDEEILELYYKNMFVGFVAILDMYNVFVQCYNELLNME